MTVDPLTVLREALKDAKAYSVFGTDDKWHVDEDVWVVLVQSTENALAAVEQLVEAALLIHAFDQAGGNDWWEAHAKLYLALARFEGDSQPEGER